MTNNEAAKWIQLYIDLAKIDPTTGEDAYLNEDDRKTLEAMEMAIDALTCNQLATDCISRQPEKHTEKRTETHACDCISRQAVTDTVRTIILGFFSDEDGVMTNTEKTLLSVNKSICDGVRALPSAQPEIIRCKDCKWCKDADGLMCKNPASWVVATECDFGCVLAERRTDERSD